jgi:hypothetical protein
MHWRSSASRIKITAQALEIRGQIPSSNLADYEVSGGRDGRRDGCPILVAFFAGEPALSLRCISLVRDIRFAHAEGYIFLRPEG